MRRNRRKFGWAKRMIALVLVAVLLAGVIAVDPAAYLRQNAAITGSQEYAYLASAMEGVTGGEFSGMLQRVQSWFASSRTARGCEIKASADLNAGRLPGALSWMEKKIALDAGADEATQAENALCAACLASLCGNAASAMAYAASAAARAPQDETTQRLLYEFARGAGDDAAAAKALAACARLSGDANELKRAAQGMIALADYKEAASLYTQAIAAGDGTDETRFQRGSCLMLSGRYEAAMIDFLKCDYPGRDYSLAVCEMAVGRLSDAAAHLENSIRLNQKLPDSRLLLAACRLEQERYQDAIGLLEDYVAAGGAMLDVAYYRATAYAGLNRYDEAIQDYDLSAAAGVYRDECLFGGAQCRFFAGKYREAAEKFSECADAGVRVQESTYYLGLCLAKTGDAKSAREALEKALQEE